MTFSSHYTVSSKLKAFVAAYVYLTRQ